jgi:hypothetical protein
MVGTAVITASRLSSAAEANQILLSPRVHAAVESLVVTQPVGSLQLKGFAQSLPTVNVIGLTAAARMQQPLPGRSRHTSRPGADSDHGLLACSMQVVIIGRQHPGR